MNINTFNFFMHRLSLIIMLLFVNQMKILLLLIENELNIILIKASKVSYQIKIDWIVGTNTFSYIILLFL